MGYAKTKLHSNNLVMLKTHAKANLPQRELWQNTGFSGSPAKKLIRGLQPPDW